MKVSSTPSPHGRFARRAITLAVVIAAGCESAVYVRTSGIVGDGGLHSGVLDSKEDGADEATGGAGGSLLGSGGLAGTGGTGPGSGGATSTGGTTGTGGATSSGGTGTGGAISSGGAPGTGGITGTGGASTGGAVGTGGAASTDTARYNFESTTQSWIGIALGKALFTSVTRSNVRQFAGQYALAGAINATAAGTYQAGVTPTAIPPGTTITFHVFFPSGSTIEWIQPYAQEGGPDFTWVGKLIFTRNLTAGAWNTMTVVIPAGTGAIGSLGVQFSLTGAWTGTVYIDSVTW